MGRSSVRWKAVALRVVLEAWLKNFRKLPRDHFCLFACFCLFVFKRKRVYLGLQFEVQSIMTRTSRKELEAAGHTASGVRKQNKSLGTIF